MKTSDVVHLLRIIEGAMEEAGRGEFRAFKLMQELDKQGYDIILRPFQSATQVQAATRIAELVDTAEPDRLFAD